MITLPALFKTANGQSKKQADVLVLIEDETLFDEKTTETDWGSNTSESNVVYTPSPPKSGDVILGGFPIDSWAAGTAGSTTRSEAAAVEYSGKMYFFGGVYPGGIRSDVWEYNISGDSWALKATTGGPPSARHGHTAFEYDGKMYIFGGFDGSVNKNDLWELDLTSFVWAQKFPTGTPPSARRKATSIESNGKAYIFGGDLADTQMHELDLSTFAWSQKASAAQERTFHSAVLFSQKIYHFGGFSSSPTYLGNIGEYDILGDTWQTITATGTPPSARGSHAAQILGHKMFVFGGFDGGYKLDLWELDLSDYSWTQHASSSTARRDSSNVIYQGKMYIFGGQNGGGWLNTIDNYDAGYYQTGSIATDNLDIGVVPVVEGEWALEDVVPENTTLIYEAWYSATGAFAGEEVSIGAIIDGQVISVLARYWRVEATLNSPTNDRYETPTLQSIKADYSTFRRFNKIDDLGYEPLVQGISSLTSRVDFFEPASIGTISIGIAMTPAISIWVDSDTLFNKLVKVKLGYKYPGLVESDYISYFSGAVDDWDVVDGVINLKLKDLSKDWKLPVPSKWQGSGDDVIYINQHHIDVILDIFQNKINVRTSGLLLDTFQIIKEAIPTHKVTRTITGRVEDAKKLVEELRLLLWAFYLPRGDGKIGIKQFDKTEQTVATFTDDNVVSIKWRANSESLINRSALYFDWDGAGDEEGDFSELDEGDNEISQTDFRAIVPFELKDKWTRATEASQIAGLKVKIFDQFDAMPSGVDIETDVKDIAIEAGDQVLVSTANAPGSAGAGITDIRFLIVSKNLDFEGSKIDFEALRVTV